MSHTVDEASAANGNFTLVTVNILHNIMVTILSKVWHPCNSKFGDLFYIFLIGTHIDDDSGEWKEVGLISHNVAVLQYFCRGTILLNCIKDYESTDEIAATSSNVTREDSYCSSYALLHPITRADNRDEVRPYSTLLEMMRLGSAYSNTTNLPVSVWEAGTNYYAQRINGRLGDLRTIRTKLQELLNSAEDMVKNCLQEFEVSIFDEVTAVDDFRCAKLNYSFVNQECGGFADAGKQYTYHMVKRFHRISAEMRIDSSFSSSPKNWLQSKLKSWWKLCDKAMIHVVMLVVLTSGMPPRMTELVQLRIRNSRYAKRNLFLLQGQLMFLSTYNKTDSVTGVDKAIARFLHHRVSKLLMTIVVCIRPAQAVLAAAYLNINESDAALARSDLLSYFCVLEGKRMNAESIRSKFQLLMLQIFTCEWTIADWRHGIIQWARVFLSVPVEKRYAAKIELQRVRSAQVGNTPRLELFRYGIEPCSFEDLDAMAIDSYREYSADFQQVLLELDSGPDTFASTDAEGHYTTTGIMVQGTTAHLDGIAPSTAIDNSFLLNAMENRMKELLKQLSSKEELMEIIKRDLVAPLHLLLRKDKYQTAANTIVTVAGNDVENEENVEKLLKAMAALRSPFKTFRSTAQRQAILHCWKNHSDLLAVLPTGGGKTAIFAIPTALEGGLTTVIILPTVALADDMEHQMKSVYNLQSVQWTNMSISDRRCPHQCPQTLLMTVECVSQELARSYLSSLKSMNRLRRIVIDEAHLILYW